MSEQVKKDDGLDPKHYCNGQVPKVGNGYEYDCEPREYSEAAKAQWNSGMPPGLAEREPGKNPDQKPE